MEHRSDHWKRSGEAQRSAICQATQHIVVALCEEQRRPEGLREKDGGARMVDQVGPSRSDLCLFGTAHCSYS